VKTVRNASPPGVPGYSLPALVMSNAGANARRRCVRGKEHRTENFTSVCTALVSDGDEREFVHFVDVDDNWRTAAQWKRK
jgi:hypothetical protein